MIVLLSAVIACEQSPTEKMPTRKKLTKAQRVENAFAQEFEKTKDPSTNTIPSERIANARAEVAARMSQSFGPIAGISWEERGPNNIGGRTRSMIYDANDPSGNTVFAGSVGGGLWRTTDITSANPNWTPINDFWSNIAVTAVAQDPNTPNNIYAGTGEGWYNGDAIRGNGIWKSTDGGTSFSQLGTTIGTFRYVNRIVVTTNGTVLASIRANVGGNGGVYRSTDGGVTWANTLNSGGTSMSPDIEIAANGDIYAAMGFAFTYSDGIYRSTDDGATWTRVYDATTNGEGRIDLATAPSNANIIYALLEVGGGTDIRRSTDGGATWNLLTQPTWDEGGAWTRGQEWYDLSIAVDPNDPNTAFIGGIDLFKTTNGGTSWIQVSKWYTGTARPYVHADQHFVLFRPGSSTDVLFANDGGVFRTTDAGNTFSTRSINYNVTQYYACATSNQPGGNLFLAGAQDNGSHRFTSAGINTTPEVLGGDGTWCHIDEDNPNLQLVAYQFGGGAIINNGAYSYYDVGNDTRFINHTDYDSDSNVLYGGSNTDEYFMITDVGGTNTVSNNTVADFGGQKVSCVMVDPNVTNRVWFAASGGTARILRVSNANTNAPTVVNRSIAGLPNGAYISNIDIEEGNSNHMLATVSNYGVNSVWESTDEGNSWTSVEGDLPDIPVRWAEFNPNNSDQAVIATEVGVWTTDNLNGGSTSWGPSNTNLANTRVDMLQFRPVDNLLVAATHGRGLFTTQYFMNIPDVDLSCSTLGTLNVTASVIDITGVQIQNTGTSNMSTTASIGFYLSPDPTITTTDIFIGSDVIPALVGGATSSHSLNVDVSTLGVPPGTYYIGYVIDYLSEVSESDEANNSCNWNAPTITVECSATPTDCININSLMGTTVGQNDNYNNYNGAAFGGDYTGPEDVIEFSTPGGAVTFTVNILSTQDLDLILMDDCDISTANVLGQSTTVSTTETISVNLAAGVYYLFVEGYGGAASDYELSIECAGVSLRPKVFLQGPLNGLTMNDDLRNAALLPNNEPYGSGLNESFSATVLSATGNDAVTDWVTVELRDATDPTIVVSTRSALVQRDGDVVDMDGVSAVKFVGVAAGNYYVAIKHRNHLSVMTANIVSLN